MKIKKRIRERKVITFYPQTRSENNGGKSTLKRVAAYCRVSSKSDEQLHSLKAQVDYYKQYITSNPDYEFAGIYADEGISGTGSASRESFNRMIENCRKGMIDMIITKSVSRFARNTVDTLKVVRELREIVVDIYFEKERLHTLSSQGEMLLTLISAIAETESLALSENIKWGLRRKYESGSINSVPLGKFYGFDKIDGKLIVNEEQAKVVRRIYKEFLDGHSFTRIAERLTADGIPTETGNCEWNISCFKKMLTNEKYKGDMMFQKTYHADHITKKQLKNNGELHKYYLENSHEAIIDKDIWECVQLELARQKQYCKDHHISVYHRSSEQNPLSARITCSTCGSTFELLKSNRVGDKGRKYWRCGSFRGRNGTVVEGKTFTPPPMPQRHNYPPNSKQAEQLAKRRKLPQERQMLCTDVEIDAKLPQEAFVKAYNQVISNCEDYLPDLEQALEGENLLTRYRAQELIDLIKTGQKLNKFDYELSLKILDHIEVTPEGKLTVIFLAGIRVMF